MSTDFRIFRGSDRSATGFQIACVALAAVMLSQLLDAYVLHELLRGSGFPAARLIAATTLGGALMSIPALRRRCAELFDAPLPGARSGEAVGAAVTLVALPFAVLGLAALCARMAGGEWGMAVAVAPAARGEISAALLVSVLEDIVYLGLLLPAWSLQWGWPRGAFATALVVAAADSRFLVAFLATLVLAALLRRAGSLPACIAAHAAANAALCHPALGQFMAGLARG